MDSSLVKQAIDVEQTPSEKGDSDITVPRYCDHSLNNSKNNNTIHNHNSITDGSRQGDLLARDCTDDNYLDDAAAIMPVVTDHYSLQSSSSRVQFRSGKAYIHNQSGSQYASEEQSDYEPADQTQVATNKQNYISMKRSNTSSLGETLVRAVYTSIAVFVGANIFIFSIGLLIFLFAHLAVQMQDVDASKIYDFCGTFLALPILVDGLTHLLVLTSGFVMDVYSGHSLLRLFGWDSVVIGWTAFVAFTGVPLATLLGLLFVQSERIVEITLISSFVSVVVFFVLFASIVCIQLVKCSLDLVQEFEGGNMDLPLLVRVKRAIWITTRSRLSGKQQNLYVYESDSLGAKESPQQSDSPSLVYMSRGKLWLRLTQLSITNCLFETLECPQRRWTRSDISGSLPFLTKDNWGLERVFCRNREQSSIVLIGGNAAMTRRQARSSTVFFFLGNISYILLLAAILVWYETPLVLTVLATILLWAYRIYKMRGSAKLAKKVNQSYYQDSSECNIKDGEEKGFTHQWKCHTITRPKHSFISVFLFLHLLFCFVFPFTFLCWSRNGSGAITFIVMSLLHFQQTIMDPEQIVEEIGADVFMEGRPDMESKLKSKYKSRLYHITSMNGYRRIWSRFLYFFIFVASILSLVVIFESGGVTTEAASSTRLDPTITFPNSTFFYQDQKQMNLATCQLDQSDSTSNIQYLADYAFLAILPYFKSETIQSLLDNWFGANVAVYHDAEAIFRAMRPDAESLVSFDLVSFPEDNTAVVLVRGTHAYFDYLADAKIWYSTALFQGFRALLPFGDFFNPLIRFNIGTLTVLETGSTRGFAYYAKTTEFVNYLKDQYSEVQITGHSLGGGIALISGAQTHSKAVGLSAPNTVLGRDTVYPKLKLDDLEKYTFNIAPEKDIFPKIGDQLSVQKIKCRADLKGSLISCHLPERSLCEMLYSCGNIDRPVLCECVSKFGYPEPNSVDGNVGFSSVCSGGK